MAQMRQEAEKMTGAARPLVLGMLEELARQTQEIQKLQSKTPGLTSGNEQTLAPTTSHAPGPCTAPSCERGCATLRQEEHDKAKSYMADNIDRAAAWGGTKSQEALGVLQEAIAAWVAAGRPEDGIRTAEPAHPVIYVA